MKQLLVGCALALVAFTTAAADLSIMPVSIQLDRERDRTTVQVTNNGSEPVVLQAEAIAWKRDAGVDRDESSDALLVNPGVFTVAPGKTQVLRVGLRRNVATAQEATYRMVLREVPPPPGDSAMMQGNVRVLVALRVPVYVAPQAVRRDERWTARYDADGQLLVQVANQGNVHYKVGTLHVQGDDPRNRIVAQGAESVLFPGEVRNFRLPPRIASAEARATNALTLEVLTDRGVQHVALDLAR